MRTILSSLLLLSIVACSSSSEQDTSEADDQPLIESMRTDRFAVPFGKLDSMTFSSYILRTYDEAGNEAKSVYHAADDAVMMQFINTYADGNKVRIDWVNAAGDSVKYIRNTFDGDGRIMRSCMPLNQLQKTGSK